jgi:hypothetical protein
VETWQGRNDLGRGNSSRPTSHGEYFNASARGGGSSNRFGNFTSGHKRGSEDREDNMEQKEFDLRKKLRKEQHFNRMGGSGPNKESHCFNCNIFLET